MLQNESTQLYFGCLNIQTEGKARKTWEGNMKLPALFSTSPETREE